MPISPKSLANLKPPFRLGQVGNPRGGPNAGATIRNWISQMTGWPRDKVEAVLENRKAPVAKRAAARIWLHASSAQTTEAGSPIAGPEFDRIFDRTEGKAQQRVQVSRADSAIDAGELAEKLAAMGWDPRTMPFMLRVAHERRHGALLRPRGGGGCI